MKTENMNLSDHEGVDGAIANYLVGKATTEEKAFLEAWIRSNPANTTYFAQIKNIWEASGGTFDPSQISTQNALKKVGGRIFDKPNKTIWRYWQKIAAILFIPLLIGGYLWSKQDIWLGFSSDITYNEVFAAYGTRSSLCLADGSKVWLNSGSSLSYPEKYTSRNRIVKLKGEAYFEVKSDTKHPFIVQTQSISVKATGTKFNIEAYPSIGKTQVTLLTGKVSVNKVREKGNESFIAELHPNQHLVYNTVSGKKDLKNEDVYKYIAWKDGKLIFRNEPLSEVLAKISQIYNVEIELQGKGLQDYPYRATFQEESLAEILNLLKLSSPIDYKEIPRSKLPDGSFSKKKIVVFSLKY